MKIDAPVRNVDLDTSHPVSELHPEVVEIMLDRGSLSDWRLLAAEIQREPWGRIARLIEEIATWDEHYGVDRLMQRVVADARERVDRGARERYAEQIRAWRLAAGLTLSELATLAGTSESTLSAYEKARVAPTTTVLGRIATVLERR